MKPKICFLLTSTMTVRCFLIDHLNCLAQKFDVTLIINGDLSDLSELESTIKIIPIDINRKVSIFSDIIVLLKLLYVFRKLKFKIIHTITPKAGLLGMIAAKIAAVPVRIHTFQGEVWVTKKGLWRNFLKFTDKIVSSFATHLLVVSNSEQAFLIDEKIIPAGKSRVLEKGSISGVDFIRFKPDNIRRDEIRIQFGFLHDDIVFLYVGRFNRDKGLLDLANAFCQVCAKSERARLLLVGHDEENLKVQIDNICSRYRERLHFIDFTTSPETYMVSSNILCLPSYREGFGVVVIEAAAAGIPAIGSRIYGISDAIVDNVTGLLHSVGNVDDLASKMLFLIDNAEIRREMGNNARERAVLDFSNELITAAFLDFYISLAKTL